jgi:hypothetical protein
MHHPDLDGDEADGVAVGGAGGDRLVADHPRAAGAVHDVHRLPSSFSRRLPMMRAVASVPPPAPHGTISVIGPLGIGAECEVETKATASAAARVKARHA